MIAGIVHYTTLHLPVVSSSLTSSPWIPWKTNTSSLTCTVLYCTVLYCTVLYCTVLYCTVLYCTVLYTSSLTSSCSVGLESRDERTTGILGRLDSPSVWSWVLYCTVLYCTVLYTMDLPLISHKEIHNTEQVDQCQEPDLSTFVDDTTCNSCKKK